MRCDRLITNKMLPKVSNWGFVRPKKQLIFRQLKQTTTIRKSKLSRYLWQMSWISISLHDDSSPSGSCPSVLVLRSEWAVPASFLHPSGAEHQFLADDLMHIPQVVVKVIRGQVRLSAQVTNHLTAVWRERQNPNLKSFSQINILYVH